MSTVPWFLFSMLRLILCPHFLGPRLRPSPRPEKTDGCKAGNKRKHMSLDRARFSAATSSAAASAAAYKITCRMRMYSIRSRDRRRTGFNVALDVL